MNLLMKINEVKSSKTGIIEICDHPAGVDIKVRRPQNLQHFFFVVYQTLIDGNRIQHCYGNSGDDDRVFPRDCLFHHTRTTIYRSLKKKKSSVKARKEANQMKMTAI